MTTKSHDILGAFGDNWKWAGSPSQEPTEPAPLCGVRRVGLQAVPGFFFHAHLRVQERQLEFNAASQVQGLSGGSGVAHPGQAAPRTAAARRVLRRGCFGWGEPLRDGAEAGERD